MGTKKNDNVILTLKKQIEDKRAKLLESNQDFKPKTNCSLEFEKERYNLHVLNKEQLQLLIVKLSILNKENKLLFPETPLKISGYILSDWIDDLNSKYNKVNIKNIEEELNSLENALTLKLSQSKKDEMDIDELKKAFDKYL